MIIGRSKLLTDYMMTVNLYSCGILLSSICFRLGWHWVELGGNQLLCIQQIPLWSPTLRVQANTPIYAQK